ncbi:MAG: hypothetical protein NWP87_00970 [Winogradskyella sp.]|nr:hypothetical protein [Winogradskyella sp.]
MFKKIACTVLLIMSVLLSGAQKNINNYKYILIPKTFDSFKTEDLYQLNSLTKFLFNKYGYEAYFVDDVLPEDLQNNRCLALTTEVSDDKKTLFKTKIEFILKDCFGDVVMTSQVGESRFKELDKAYNESLRAAFTTFQDLNYKYVPKETELISKEKVVVAPLAVKSSDSTSNTAQKQITSNQFADEFYYAQAIDNGFQLVNSEPKIVMILWTTAAKNVFLVKGKSAIVFKEDNQWYYSENDGSLEEKQYINIKF